MNGEKKIITVRDETIGLLGYLAIDSAVRGSYTGGIRMLPDITPRELKDLARSMTLKQGFVGIPKGGARAGIVLADRIPFSKKQELLNRFGEKISQLIISKKYLPAPDMGTTPELILNMYRHIGARRSTTSPVSRNSGYFTSLSMLTAMKQSLAALGFGFKEAAFAVEGFGSVGSALALNLYNDGVRVVAVSTIDGAVYNIMGLNIPELIKCRDAHGDNWINTCKEGTCITKEELLELPVDVLCPCGRSYQINKGNMEKIKARVICAGSNNPVTPEADDYLFKNGVLYLPDFATNCGGALGSAMEFLGLGEKHIKKVFNEQISTKFSKIIEISRKKSKSPLLVGTKIAEESFLELQRTKEQKTGTNLFLDIALNMYRNGFVPAFFARNYAVNYFRKALERDNYIYEKYFNT